MQPEHIRMSDHSPSVGEERMVFVQPHPLQERQYLNVWWNPNVLQPRTIEQRLSDIESRIAELESRTWWSMLKEWISACRLRIIGR